MQLRFQCQFCSIMKRRMEFKPEEGQVGVLFDGNAEDSVWFRFHLWTEASPKVYLHVRKVIVTAMSNWDAKMLSSVTSQGAAPLFS